MKRTDIHRPSAPEFDPGAYQFRGCYVLPGGGDTEDWDAPRRMAALHQILDVEGYRWGSHGISQCGHCGAYIRFIALFVHPEAKHVISVGEDCMDNRFSLNKAEFAALREKSRLMRDKAVKAEKVRAFIAGLDKDQSDALAWAESLPIPAWDEPETSNHRIARDIFNALGDRGELTTKQIALLVRLHQKEVRKETMKAETVAQLAAGEISPVPVGRVKVQGTIVSNVLKQGWGDDAMIRKLLVRDDRGFKIWGNCPSLMNPAPGSRIEFTATLEPSKDDPAFGFYKRAAKVSVVEGEPLIRLRDNDQHSPVEYRPL